jgi:hypothetical protein
MKADEVYVKWLGPDGRSTHGDRCLWPLPVRSTRGSWRRGEPVTTASKERTGRTGLSVDRIKDLWNWRNGAPYLVECEGPLTERRQEVFACTARVLRPLRWTARERRLYAADSAERALSWDRRPDPACDVALEAARRYARGEISVGAIGVCQRAAQVSERRKRAQVRGAESEILANPDCASTYARYRTVESGHCAAEAVLFTVDPEAEDALSAPEFAVAAAASAAAALAASRFLVTAADTTAFTFSLADPSARSRVGSLDAAVEAVRRAEREWQAMRVWFHMGEGGAGESSGISSQADASFRSLTK